MEYLDPTELYGYQDNLDRLKQQYGRGLARNTFDLGNAEQNFTDQNAQQGLMFDRQRDQLPGSFVGRGVFNSGIYRQGLQNYAQNRSIATNQLLTNFSQQRAGLLMDQGQMNDDYRAGRDSIQGAMGAARSAKAAQIKTFLQTNG